MNKHMEMCDSYRPDQTRLVSSESSSRQLQLSTSSKCFKTDKSIDCHKEKMKSLLAEWICSNIRPISIVEDSGFKQLIQEAIKIGELS